MYFNLHTHHPVRIEGVIEIENMYYGQAKAPEAQYRSAGLHPWYISKEQLPDAFNWLRKEAAQVFVVAIGEAGLDKVCDTPWPLQLAAFQYCVEISEQYKKPLIIHCVRAYAEIIGLKQKWNPRQAWIFHGFNKAPSMAELILKSGSYLSFGAAILRTNNMVVESLKLAAGGVFFLETDASSIEIEAIYKKASEHLGIQPSQLQQVIGQNKTLLFPGLADT